MLEELKEKVLEANLALVRHGLVILTWGNASGLDRGEGLMVIKPSGVAYASMRASDMAVVSLSDGKVVEGAMRPSSDAATHLAFYRAFEGCGGVVHTHSAHATAWAQAGLDIPAQGTTHADYFHGPIPCARALTKEEIEGDYELATGEAIIEAFRLRGIDPASVPGALAHSHGPFAWGSDPLKAVENSVVLEEVARLGLWVKLLSPDSPPMGKALLDRHFWRKHGPGAYYGQ
jgi:L-ribulose-5-phosphate 4-epimerase